MYRTVNLKYMVLPWANTARGVYAYSYFTSVLGTEEALGIGINFCSSEDYHKKIHVLRRLNWTLLWLDLTTLGKPFMYLM